MLKLLLKLVVGNKGERSGRLGDVVLLQPVLPVAFLTSNLLCGGGSLETTRQRISFAFSQEIHTLILTCLDFCLDCFAAL